MDILSLNKILVLIIILSIFSCRDKDKKCIYKKFNPKIVLEGFQPNDKEIREVYLLIYNNNFTTKIDSIAPTYIINYHKKKNYRHVVNMFFDEININTEKNYILVTNGNTKYNISNYTLKLDSVMVGMHLQKTCIIDSMKVNNGYIKDIGATLTIHKNLGLPLN